MDDEFKYVIIYDSQKEFPLEKDDYQSNMVCIGNNPNRIFEIAIYKREVRTDGKLKKDIIMEQAEKSNFEIQEENGVYTLVKKVNIPNLNQLISKRKIERNTRLNERLEFMLKSYKKFDRSIAFIPKLYENSSMEYLSEFFKIVEGKISELPKEIRNYSMRELNNLLAQDPKEETYEKNLKKFYELIRT